MPIGTSFGLFNGSKYKLTHTHTNHGKNEKFYAEQLSNTDFISFNLYHLKNQKHLLKPCEMPEEKVIHFIENVQLIQV
ncbi:MAG: peptide methionine sulfoxide reductase [Rhizobiales bacterium]|nr:peptide methionine sulfoxide reductase [Hyphomicrobiales bacterium]